jgi:hypothetical protein
MGEREEIVVLIAGAGSNRAAADDIAGKSWHYARRVAAPGGRPTERAAGKVPPARSWCVPAGRPRRVVSDLLSPVGLTDRARAEERP